MLDRFSGVLKSRKFWAAVISLLVATGILQVSEGQETELVNAILLVAGAAVYILSVALEDGLSKWR
jgi:hypothetical protein